MSDIVRFTFNLGSVDFDFDNKKIVFDRSGSFAQAMHLKSMEINFSDITDVEMRPAKLLKVPAFCFIVNGKRLITDIDINATQFTLERSDEARARSTLKRLIKECNLSDIKNYERKSVPKEVFVEKIGKTANDTNPKATSSKEKLISEILAEYKEQLRNGEITQEEYEERKNKLLS